MKPQDLLKVFPSYAAAARKIGVTKGRIWQWKDEGEIPGLRQIQIERLTGGVLKASEAVKRKYL